MVVNRSALVPRTQRKKLELNPSYGYGAMSKNVSKCVHACAFGAFNCAFNCVFLLCLSHNENKHILLKLLVPPVRHISQLVLLPLDMQYMQYMHVRQE